MTFTINNQFLKENNLEKYEKVFIFLEQLRQSGVTNMFGALPYLIEFFPEFSEKELKKCHLAYIQNYEDIYQFKEER
jgi:hypothetical protein